MSGAELLVAIFREMATSERPWEGSALCCDRGGGKTGRQMLFSGITSVCSPGLGFRSFARSGGWLLFVSFRDGAVARIFIFFWFESVHADVGLLG